MRFQIKLLLLSVLVVGLLSGLIFVLTRVLNASPFGFINNVGQSKPVIGWEEFIDLLQVAVAACAVIIAPGLFARLSDRVRGRVVAECKPIAFDPQRGARAWRVLLRSSARHLNDLTVSVYPRSQGNTVVTSRARTHEDGGLVYHTQVDRGCLNVLINRFAPNRRLDFSVLFERADDPAFHSTQVAVRVRKPAYDEVLRLSGHSLYLTHHRISLILALFVSIYLMLCLRIISLT